MKSILKCRYEDAVKIVSVTSPLGLIGISACPLGLHGIDLQPRMVDGVFTPDMKAIVEYSGPTGESGSDVVKMCIDWLQAYFRSPSIADGFPKPPLCITNDGDASFREKVWLSLSSKVGAGQTVSYSQLAELADNPKAARAVGSAMSHNPFPLLVPCHRVIRHDSTLGHFGCGIDVKKWLLKLEGAACVQV